MRKTHLLTPGPTPVPERVALAMAQPVVHHRSPEFEALFQKVREDLRWLFGTSEDVLTFSCSGSGAMEGAVVNFLRRGDQAVVVDGGRFGERWWKICRAYGVEPVILKVEWGKAVDPAAVEQALRAHSGARAVFLQASESSTGVAHPVREIAEITRRRDDVLCAVDAISALGAMDLPMDAWGIDLLVAGSQKALMLPPGLAFGAASAKAWKLAERSDLPRFYFDWRKQRDMERKNQTSFTPAVSLVRGLAEVLAWMRSEGKEAIFAHHERLARAARAGVIGMGLKLYAERPVVSITTVVSPVDSDRLVKLLRDRYQVTLVGGQDAAKGKIFRIAHLGWFDDYDIVIALSALERALAEMGHPIEFGRGVGAAQAVLAGKA